jgi:hypothetical protein
VSGHPSTPGARRARVRKVCDVTCDRDRPLPLSPFKPLRTCRHTMSGPKARRRSAMQAARQGSAPACGHRSCKFQEAMDRVTVPVGGTFAFWAWTASWALITQVGGGSLDGSIAKSGREG